MTDLARLGIVIDTTQIKEARQALEKLAKVGGGFGRDIELA